MKPVRTWVLIADGGHAKVLETRGPGSGLEAQADMTFSVDLPRSHEILTDRAVRSYESRGHARHAKGDSVDPHRELKRAFAKQLGKELLTRLSEDRFDRLVLVAPPPALGDLRAALPRAVRARVVGEVAQDLVKTPKARLWPHLAQVLGPEPVGPARRTAGKAR
jgi:protein required for attachment to host cells